MQSTLDAHVKLEGDIARIIESIIEKGRAASKTEAIRLCVLDYNNHHPVVEIEKNPEKTPQNAHIEERKAWFSLGEKSLRRIWDNPKDDEVWNRY